MKTISGWFLVGTITISLVCLLGGTALLTRWKFILVVFLLLGLWMVLRRRPKEWTSSFLLGIYTLAAAGGIAAGGSSILLLTGITSATIAWDLDYSRLSLAGNAGTQVGRGLERKRLVLLGLVGAASTALIALGLHSRLSLPFGVLFVLVLVALGSLSAVGRLLQRSPE